MIEHRVVKQFRCSMCNKWFNEKDDTLFLTHYSHDSAPQKLAVFCSEKCKKLFNQKIFPTVNNLPKDKAC